MENKVSFIQSVTLILCGGLLQACGNIADGWSGAVVVVAGFILFYVGLGNLSLGLDDIGRRAVGLLRIAAIVGIIGGVIDIIPLMGLMSGLLYIAAFILQVLGFLQLKNSLKLGAVGSSGVSLLVAANALAVIATLFGILPIVGGFLASFLYLGTLALIILGWLRVQESLIRQNSTLNEMTTA
ncbi:MAG: hypothetical protein Q7T20_05905 [Saprospiraceae bacterium]|nr:hypothetical protein [Saprospiraceae bacterium]